MSGITNPAEKYFKDGLWTYDGTVWRPQNQLLAYRNVVRQYNTYTAPGAGAYNVDGAAVPAGEVWIITSVTAQNENTAASILIPGILAGASMYRIGSTAYLATTRYIQLTGWYVLAATEKIRVTFVGCALNDVLNVWIVGHKFNIAE